MSQVKRSMSAVARALGLLLYKRDNEDYVNFSSPRTLENRLDAKIAKERVRVGLILKERVP